MASLLAFALAAPQRYPAVINPQGDGVAAAASPTAVSLNSTRMYSDYLESRVQFEPATYDGCDSAMPEPRRFLMVVDAREQLGFTFGLFAYIVVSELYERRTRCDTWSRRIKNVRNRKE